MTQIVRFAQPTHSHAEPADTADTELAMACALTFALEARNPGLGLVEHCSRVADLALRIADEVGLDDENRTTVWNAARLHEIGMLAIPDSLLERAGPLTIAEIERVRAHAWIGAEIVRATFSERTAWLVEHQYSDHQTLRSQVPSADELKDLALLAGIFRVADVFVAMSCPRPYQDVIPLENRLDVLRSGSGDRFHPDAVGTLFQMRPSLS